MILEISKGIAIPSKHHGVGVTETARRLEIGESFFLPGGNINNVCRLISHTKKGNGKKFTCRTIDGGVRVWRVG